MTERIAPVPGTGKPFGVPNLVQRCMGAAQGCGTALALLMRVAYWTPRARIWRQGHLWIAKSGDEWRTEAALRRKQYKSVLAKLKRRDIWLHHYNHERPHLGYRNQGRRPWETVERFVRQGG